MQRSDAHNRLLIIGYGNPGRQDDGLGPACAQRIADWAPEGVRVQQNYQLTVEDALEIAESDVTLFIDASVDSAEPYRFHRIGTQDSRLLGHHSLTPAALLELSQTLFNGQAQGFVLGIRGYRFDRFEERLSEQAEHNLRAALGFLERWIPDIIS